MRLLYFAVGLLWVIVGLAAVGFLSLLGADSVTLGEKAAGGTLLVFFGGIAGWQLSHTHKHMRDMTANRVVVTDEAIEIQLSGRAREWKGLPDVPLTRIPWAEALSIVAEKKRFVYPSVIPMGYPLEVFTLYSKAGGISFTRECIADAKIVARRIASKLGSEL